MSPNAYIIAGPEGAGRTTFAREFLPNYANCRIFVNGDLIAQGMPPVSLESAGFRAGRLMLEEIEFHAGRGEDFGFETTLAGKGHLQVISGLKKRGYQVHIFYLWLPSVELALARIKERVLRGGHDVAEKIVIRRYKRSIRNFLLQYREVVDGWVLYDNSAAAPVIVAHEEHGNFKMVDGIRYSEVARRYGIMTKPPANVLELPLFERANLALKAAVEKVIEEHAREGLPLYIWRDGKVVAVPAEEFLPRS